VAACKFAGVFDSKAVAMDIVSSDKCLSDSSSLSLWNLNDKQNLLKSKFINIIKHTFNPNACQFQYQQNIDQ
jgi:hypothetical protein